MLTITYGSDHEDIVELDLQSAPFVACLSSLTTARIGVRPDLPGIPSRARHVQLLVSGVYVPGVGVSRELVSLPAPRVFRIYDIKSGRPLQPVNDSGMSVKLDLVTATTTITQRLEGDTYGIELEITQFVADSPQDQVVTAIRVQRSNTASTPVDLRIEYGLDDSAVNEYLGTAEWLTARHYRVAGTTTCSDGFNAVVSAGQHRVSYYVRAEVQSDGSNEVVSWVHGARCTISTSFDLAASDTHELVTRWRVVPESDKPSQADASATECSGRLLARHRVRWSQLWADHAVDITAVNDPAAFGLRYAVFQLLQHGDGAHQHGKNGVISPARGLTSTYHSGATFFDTELHKIPFWIWNDPRVARAMIDFRYHRLAQARAFAEGSGFTGARFPEATNDLGNENGPHYVLSYPEQQAVREWSVHEVLHISACVCYALCKYWTVTGDDEYMAERGAVMAGECARYAASVFTWSHDKNAYVINSVMGADEYHYHVNNSFFTNYMLRWAIVFACELESRGFPTKATKSELARWKVMINSVYLPWMTSHDIEIPEEFEGYSGLPDTKLRTYMFPGPQFRDAAERDSADNLANFTTRLVKQADVVLLMSLFPNDFSEATKRATFEFYEPRTVHESSLSCGPHAIVAADIGDVDRAAEFIRRASRYNLDFTPVGNYSNGLHLSSCAGAWQGVVEGLAGVWVHEGQLSIRPRLPTQWQSYCFRLRFRGNKLTVTVRAGGTEVICPGAAVNTNRDEDGRIHISIGVNR